MGLRRTIMINLVAFDFEIAQKFSDDGLLRGLDRLLARSAAFPLQHGVENCGRDTGRSNEHVATGLSPQTTHLWSNFLFEPHEYRVDKLLAASAPFQAFLNARSVVFDPSYFDLQSAKAVQGLTGWSSHEDSCEAFSRPAALRQQIKDRFGVSSVDHAYLNKTVYGDAQRTAEFGARLNKNVKKRFEIFEWLISERFTDWDLAYLSIEESHDAIEHLAHGAVPNHHYAGLPCAAAAEHALLKIYRSIVDGLNDLINMFPGVQFAFFSMHGMGANKVDVPSMLLLPELMYRWSTGRSFFQSRGDWRRAGRPVLAPDEEWSAAVTKQMRPDVYEQMLALSQRVARRTERFFGGTFAMPASWRISPDMGQLGWVPAMHYRRFWPRMTAFALPSLNRGQIRVNLKGRESAGKIDRANYMSFLDALERFIGGCTEPRTGRPIASSITRVAARDPYDLHPSQGDLEINWNENVFAIAHDEIEMVGPAPVRRMGGHAGGDGALFCIGKNLKSGAFERRSSYDVVPAIVDLFGHPPLHHIDGESPLAQARQRKPFDLSMLEHQIR